MVHCVQHIDSAIADSQAIHILEVESYDLTSPRRCDPVILAAVDDFVFFPIVHPIKYGGQIIANRIIRMLRLRRDGRPCS